MKIRKWLLVSVLLIAMALPALAMQQVKLDFSRYDIILSRKPFGSNAVPPPVSDHVASQRVNPAKSFIKDYNMCAIRESLVGVSVGLVNIKAKPARSFFLYEGDSEDGVLLVEANFREEKALLRKDGEECWISMSGAVRSATAPRGAQSQLSGSLFGVQRLITSRLKQRRINTIPYKGLTKDEYKIKRASGEIPPPIPVSNFLNGHASSSHMTREEREVKLRKYNMDLIRAGGKKGMPLPITLTIEEDQKLVGEGVLPPR